MSLRKSYAAVLQLLRTKQGMTQTDISGAVTQAHVSHLELAKGSVTLDVAYELALALKIQPSSMFTLLLAAYAGRSAREVLRDCLAELEEMGIADQPLPAEPRPLPTTAMIEAKRKWKAVQELKARGLTQAEAAKELAMAKTTLRRLWYQAEETSYVQMTTQPFKAEP
jgi:transcriptional regulator with XRE-family HTH domain